MNQSINTDSKNSKEPQQKYRLGTVSIEILEGGLKPVLRAPNLALSFWDCLKDRQIPFSDQTKCDSMVADELWT